MSEGAAELGLYAAGAGDGERVTGIEPALSAWESDRSRLVTAPTWAPDVPLVTVIDPATPLLMARQWPAA